MTAPISNGPATTRLHHYAGHYLQNSPTQQKTPISAHSRRAGRKLSRSRHKQPEQGEPFPANHHPPATQRTRPGTKLSQQPPHQGQTGTKPSQQPPPQGQTGTKLSPHSKKHLFQPIRGEQGENYHGRDANNPSRENFFPQTTTHQPRSAHAPVQNSPGNPDLKAKPVQNSPSNPRLKAKPVQNSPSNPHLKAKPVQNSPSTAKNAHFGPFNASREKIIPVQTQTTRAGRTFSRKPPLTSHAAHTTHSPVQNSPGNPHLKAKPVQNSPHTRRVSPAIHKPTTHNPHKPAHKRRGPGRLTVCPAPGPSSNDAAQSLTA